MQAIKILKPGPRVTEAGLTPVTVKLIPVNDGEVKVETKGFDLDNGMDHINNSVMSHKEADDLATGMIDAGWQVLPIQLR